MVPPAARPSRRRISALLGLWVSLWLLGGTAAAAVTVHSRSGQFIVHSSRPTPPSLSQPILVGTNRTVVTLQPDPLAVSCERIKAAMLAELGFPDRWRGKIHVTIEPRMTAVAFPTAVAVRYADGWNFSLRLPQEIEGRALVRGVVQALLTEIANRNPGPGAPELPLWLVEALTGQILARIGPDPLARLNPLGGKYGTSIAQLQAALSERKLGVEIRTMLDGLRARPLLTFEEISLPSPDRLEGESGEHYAACARLLFTSLRELRGGPQCFATMLAQLSQRLNWQTAFLVGFQRHFSRLLDVEKWWALGTRHLRAAVGSSSLTSDTGLLWLEDLLMVSIVSQPGPGQPAQRRIVPLRTVVVEWDPPLQAQVLAWRANQLRQLAPNLPSGPRELALGYADALRALLEQRSRGRVQPSLRGLAAYQTGTAVRDAVARLDALDAQREELYRMLNRTQPSATPAPVSGGPASRP